MAMKLEIRRVNILCDFVKQPMEEEINQLNAVLQSEQYTALAKINEGSYGQIFRVRDRKDGHSYALKAMELQKLEHMQKAHEAALEVMILQKLNHPGIIKLHDFIRNQRYIGLVMELCPHGDVFTLMRNVNKKLDLALKKRKIMIYYLAQIVEAVDYLHTHGVIHRDLKPENIVLGNNFKIRIIDFGTAKVLPESTLFSEAEHKQALEYRDNEIQRSRKSFVGTTNYMSPETIDLDYSFKSDIWALGILAYKFYFNRLPYEGTDSLEIFKKIKVGHLPLDPDTDPDFKQFFEMTLAQDPEARPTTTQLKKSKLFGGIDFDNVFNMPAPIGGEELTSASEENSEKTGGYLFECDLEKRMFFGNYKPRILTIQKVGSHLMMAYRYVANRKVKNEFELNLNDYAQVLKGNEFEVVTSDKRYRFRVLKGGPQKAVQQINDVIRSNYKLS